MAQRHLFPGSLPACINCDVSSLDFTEPSWYRAKEGGDSRKVYSPGELPSLVPRKNNEVFPSLSVGLSPGSGPRSGRRVARPCVRF